MTLRFDPAESHEEYRERLKCLAAAKGRRPSQQDDLRILIALSLCHPANSRKS